MSWIEPGTQNFLAIGLGVSALQLRDFVHGDFLRFLVLQLGYSLHPWTDVNAKYVKRRHSGGKEVTFGGHDDYV